MTFLVLFFALCLLCGGFVWFAIHNGREQLFELEKNTGRPYRAETIDLLARRSEKIRQEQERVR